MSTPLVRDWQVDGIAALKGLTPKNQPALEILYLDALAARLLGGGLEPPYTVEHGSETVAFLLRAVARSTAYAPDRTPTPSEAMTKARSSFLTGAHDFAGRGLPGLAQLVNRVITAAVGELEMHTGAPEEQVRALFRYGLLAVASGPANEVSPVAAEGVDELFEAWDGLIGDGFVPPWRVPSTADAG
ncbi:MAG TPA: hypothetical protein VGC37_12015 [Friedmanniella sp.]